ncbi:hypothetical protein [Fictibacillus terranigra]|uniref:Uncharacterized protein n=1 Tax=Fictibacillus terranigra TaxID=3058424 RepID=A0ABT8E6T5_9BACL|nr:hypothetical protein [Fictibacillus sp. CENA-BCM004]MDN4073622.1 hypothetical protein [Fictibacillus sp. CENA-BCM004]
MAFDLKAVIRLNDQFSRPMRQIQRQTETMNKMTQRTTSSMSKMQSRGTSAFSKIASASKAVAGPLAAVAGGFAAAQGAAKLFNATVGEAAKLELAQVQVSALFQKNTKAAEKFFKFLNKAGADSMFSQEDFFGAGKAYVPLTKSVKQLEYAVKITERLAASNPLEGMEGAAFSIREALSGDLVSLSERFNLPKKMLASVKSAGTLQGKLQALDKVLATMGYNQSFLNKVNETGLIKWQKLIDTVKLKLASFGKAGLEAAKPVIDQLTRMANSKAFELFGQKLSAGIAAGFKGLESAIAWAENYINTHFINNPKFYKLPDIKTKIKFVIEDIWSTFMAWFNREGAGKIASMSRKIIESAARQLEAASPVIASAAVRIGSDIGKAIFSGAKNYLTSHPIEATIKVIKPAASLIRNMLPQNIGRNAVNWGVKEGLHSLFGGKGKSHAGGLSNVPYNGYSATLHKGERVLTPEENKAYSNRKGPGGGGVVIQNISITAGPTDKHTVKKLMDAFADELENAGWNGAAVG